MNNLRTEYGNHTISPVKMGEFSHTLRTLQTVDPQSEMHDLKPFQVLSVERVEDVSAFNFMFQYDSFGANKKWGLP